MDHPHSCIHTMQNRAQSIESAEVCSRSRSSQPNRLRDGGPREKREDTIAALILAPTRIQAEDVAELPRLVRGAGLRFKSFLDRLFISHSG